MKFNVSLFVLVGGVQVCGAITAPWAAQCETLAEIAAVAVGRSASRTNAIRVLELVALGRTQEIDSETASALGLPAGDIRDAGFADPAVRVCALRSLGETGLSEAVDFLRGLKPADFASDRTEQTWPAAHLALHEALLGQISDTQQRIEFLMHVVTSQRRGATALWAVNQLCDAGALSALPAIRESINDSWHGQYGAGQIRFCEARIQIVRSDPDRVKALSSVLKDGGSADERLLRWAVGLLTQMDTPSADAAVDRFLEGSAGQQQWSSRGHFLTDLRQETLRMRRVRPGFSKEAR